MSAAHIQIARGEREFDGRTGPKAAFDFYVGHPTVASRDNLATIRSAGNKKQQFAAYCSIHGEKFGPVNGNGAVRSTEQVEEVKESLTARLAARLSRNTEPEAPAEEVSHDVTVEAIAKSLGIDASALSALVNESKPVTKGSTKREIPTPERISFPMAMAIKKICTRNEWEFAFTSKTGQGRTANYGITVNGESLSPDEASTLIGEAKAA